MIDVFPAAPDAHAIAALLLTVLVLFLFTRERIPLELTSVGLLAVLCLGFTLMPYPGLEVSAFFAGFGHEALIAVCALMVIGQGLVVTGALEPVGRFLAAYWGKAPFLLLGLTLIIGMALSAFVNNTPVVVLLLPILVSVCLRTNSSPSKVLMPMGFATLVGGMGTTIGTSTNLLVVAVAADLGLAPMAMFDFIGPAAIAASVAIVYLWFIAPRMLPDREVQLIDPSPRLFEARLQLDDDSPMIGKTLAEAVTATSGDMKVTRVRRGETFVMPLPDVVLKAGDRLRVRDTPAKLKRYEAALKATLYADQKQKVDAEHPLRAENQTLAELAIVQGSAMERTNLRIAQFLDRYQLVVLALHRAGKDIWRTNEDIHDVILMPGDVLLVQGPADQIINVKSDDSFLLLDANMEVPRTNLAPVALAITAAVVVVAALGIMPIAISALTGCALLLITRCMDMQAAIRAISPSVFFIVVASLALGKALIETGATTYATEVFLYWMADAAPWVVISALMMLLAVLTNVVSNNAAAVIGTPIGVTIAQQLGLPPEPFVLAVLFGANMSFATPMAYQTNLLVMSAGNYTFSDFLRVGVPLTLLMWATLTWVLSAMYF